jgi:hypothetical protein
MSSVRTDGSTTTPPAASPTTGSSMAARIAAAWAFVGIPLAYGVYETVKKASALF